MRKIVVLFLILILLPNVFAAVSKPVITVRLERYDPVPVEPGNVFDVWVGVDNKGTSAHDFKLRMSNKFPFTTQEVVEDLGNLPQNEKVQAHFVIKTDAGAQNRDYNITFEYRWGDEGEWWIQSSSQIQVRTSDASVSIIGYEANEISPGGETALVMTLENTGRSIVKDMDIMLNLPEQFSPLGTSTTKRVTILKPGEKTMISYNLIADPGAELKVYPIPVSVSFSDERNNKYAKTTGVSAVINAKADLLFSVDSIEHVEEGLKIQLKAINRGVVGIKYLTVKLLPGNYTLLNTGDTQYLGNVDSDDFEVLEVLAKPQDRQMSILLEAAYKDQYNKDFTQNVTLPITVPGKEQTGRWWIGGIAIVVLAGSIWCMRRKK